MVLVQLELISESDKEDASACSYDDSDGNSICQDMPILNWCVLILSS
jgi:hypothetical protein